MKRFDVEIFAAAGSLQRDCRREYLVPNESESGPCRRTFQRSPRQIPNDPLERQAGSRQTDFMRNHQKGVTLFEILIVLAILSFAATVAASAFGGSNGSPEAKALAGAIAGELKLARSRAIGSAEIATVYFDNEVSRYRSDAAPEWTPIGKKLSIAISSATPAAGDTAAILYYPDGSSSGGEVTVAAKARIWIVRAALNGKVSVDEER